MTRARRLLVSGGLLALAALLYGCGESRELSHGRVDANLSWSFICGHATATHDLVGNESPVYVRDRSGQTVLILWIPTWQLAIVEQKCRTKGERAIGTSQ